MKRIKKIVLLLIFVLLLIPFTTAYAANCSDVQKAVNELEELENSYMELGCDSAEDEETISQCTEVQVNKALVLAKIFKYNDDKVCPSIDLSSIIEEYADDCSNEFSSEVKELSDSVMNIFFISAPFVLIVFGSLDFFKVLAGNNPAEMKKNRSNFIKRLVAFILLYLTPVIVRFLFSLTPYDLNGTTYICDQTVDFNKKISSAAVKGTYNGYKGGKKSSKREGGGDSADGDAIADAARECKEYAQANDFTYSDLIAHNAVTAFSDQNYEKTVCCASLIGASIYKAGIYDAAKANEIYSESAGTVSSNLDDNGWEVIWDADDLEAGDVIVYRCVNAGYCGTYTIGGTTDQIGHVEIYAGNGQKYNTGSTNAIQNYIESDFNIYLYNSDGSVNKEFFCGLRYPGD